jgi:hypothetical protein
MGGWAIAQSPILGTTITIQRLKKRLYESMLNVYFRINPSLYEPPYEPVPTFIVGKTRTYGGVRPGADIHRQ